jgi:hypothetical protein
VPLTLNVQNRGSVYWLSTNLKVADGPKPIAQFNGVLALAGAHRSESATWTTAPTLCLPCHLRGPPSTGRYQDPWRPAAAEPRPPPAAGSAPNPPLRSPIQSVWVASFSSVAMASSSSAADTILSRASKRIQDEARHAPTGRFAISAEIDLPVATMSQAALQDALANGDSLWCPSCFGAYGLPT